MTPLRTRRRRRAEADRVRALQDELTDLRRRRSQALQEAEQLRESLLTRLQELRRLGAKVEAPELPGVASAGDDVWKPPTEAPEVPDGWQIGPPDFVGVGCQRAGTTWSFRMLSNHPRVQPPLPPGKKELHYLERFFSGQMRPEQVQGYYERLPRPPGHLAGEWTPGYIGSPAVPRLLAQIAPSAKTLVMVRDPLERFRSAIAYASRDGKSTVGAGAQAMRSLYLMQLRRLLRHVPRERVLVLQYERCHAQPEDELRRTWAYLGLDPAEAEMPEFSEQVGHQISRVPLEPGLEEDLLAFWADDIVALGRELPEVDLALWPSARRLGLAG